MFMQDFTVITSFLQAEVAKVVETQTSLERQLELIETHQREVCVSSKFLFLFPLLALTILHPLLYAPVGSLVPVIGHLVALHYFMLIQMLKISPL